MALKLLAYKHVPRIHPNMQKVKNRLVEKGCYTLVISLRKRKQIQVGRLGNFSFPAGTYLYTGSAMNGLAARLSYHLRKSDKKRHWHIDYLLRCPESQIRQILVYPGEAREECDQNQRIAILPGAKLILKGFGASDCVSGCASHLAYFPKGYSWSLPADPKL